MATKGYPEHYERGFKLDIPDDLENVYVAGAKKGENGELLSDGGRVLGVTARAATLPEAIDSAYAQVKRIGFPNGFYRHDIGQKALAALKGEAR